MQGLTVAHKGTGYASLWALVYVRSRMCYTHNPASRNSHTKIALAGSVRATGANSAARRAAKLCCVVSGFGRA
jgi:hypothetical protein